MNIESESNVPFSERFRQGDIYLQTLLVACGMPGSSDCSQDRASNTDSSSMFKQLPWQLLNQIFNDVWIHTAKPSSHGGVSNKGFASKENRGG